MHVYEIKIIFCHSDIFPFPRRCHKQERVSLVAQAPLAATDGSMDPRYSFNFTAAAGFEARHNLVLGCRVCSAGAADSCSEAETPVLVSQVSCSLLAMVLKGVNKKRHLT